MSDTTLEPALISVIHPLDDVREVKLFRPELGRMAVTPIVRISLTFLQLYLAGMVVLVAWRVLTGS